MSKNISCDPLESLVDPLNKLSKDERVTQNSGSMYSMHYSRVEKSTLLHKN